MIYVTRIAHFNAAHRLHNPEKPDEWNRRTFGPCNHPNWHGHNYRLEVVVSGEPDSETGYLIDLGRLKRIIHEEIVSQCDHKNLNLDVPFLKERIPTAENLARSFFERLQAPVEAAAAPGARLHSVKVYETERNIAEYRPEPG